MTCILIDIAHSRSPIEYIVPNRRSHLQTNMMVVSSKRNSGRFQRYAATPMPQHPSGQSHYSSIRYPIDPLSSPCLYALRIPKQLLRLGSLGSVMMNFDANSFLDMSDRPDISREKEKTTFNTRCPCHHVSPTWLYCLVPSDQISTIGERRLSSGRCAEQEEKHEIAHT